MTFRDGPHDGEDFGATDFGEVAGQDQATHDQTTHNPTTQDQVVRLQVHLTPASSVPGFHACVSGGRLDAPLEFSDAAAFVRFLQRIAERGPGLK